MADRWQSEQLGSRRGRSIAVLGMECKGNTWVGSHVSQSKIKCSLESARLVRVDVGPEQTPQAQEMHNTWPHYNI